MLQFRRSTVQARSESKRNHEDRSSWSVALPSAKLAWKASLVTILWLNASKTALNFVTGAIASFRCLPAHSGPKAQGHMVVEARC